MPGPTIRRLSIERFRGIAALTWRPAAGVNLVLGGGDVGKTTILEAVSLLLSPTNAGVLSDTDYHARDVTAEFVIEAVMSLPDEPAISDQLRAAWPWVWNGTDAVVPSLDGDGAQPGEPVYRFRVRGTAQLELTFEVVQPDGNADPFSVALRRAIGLVRLGGDDRDRDLRLVQGSALDRLVSDSALRARIAADLADTDIEERLLPAGKAALNSLDDAFEEDGLPDLLGLSIVGGPGPSIASLIGLTAGKGDDFSLPLTTWGAGTRRLAALTIAAHNRDQAPITIVDELERGLEPVNVD
jgi:putative ATP-dependent endonuclease of OLD family